MFEIKCHCGHRLSEKLQALWGAPKVGPCLVPILRVRGYYSVTLASHLLSSSLSVLTCEMGTLEVPAHHPCIGGCTDWPAILEQPRGVTSRWDIKGKGKCERQVGGSWAVQEP